MNRYGQGIRNYNEGLVGQVGNTFEGKPLTNVEQPQALNVQMPTPKPLPEETPKSLFEQLIDKTQEDVDNRREYLEELREHNKSMRQALFAKALPKEDKEREQRLQRLGKTQAITDFLSALAGGIIGTSTKNYSPATPNVAGQYSVDLSNLRQINEARREKANQLQMQLELANMAEEEKYAAADLATAQEQKNAIIKHLADLEEKGVDFANKKALQDEAAKAKAEEAEKKRKFDSEENEKERKHDSAENAKRNTATKEAAEIRANGRNKNKIEFGDFIIKGAPESDLTALYFYLVDATKDKVEPVQEYESGIAIGAKENPTPNEMKAWVRKNRKALLPHLQSWSEKRNYDLIEDYPQEVATTETYHNNHVEWE